MENQTKLNDFERFIKDRGFEFTTDEALKAGYDRVYKARHDILLSQDEFIAEANTRNNYNPDVLIEVYGKLIDLYNAQKLKASDVYQFARFKWCLSNPDAIVAYETSQSVWNVNNCATEVSHDEAVVRINAEWGFEASRIKIIGKPYYDASDYQYIRFDCAYMRWLYTDGQLYQVIE
jgi:hypothetical protein